MKRLFLNDVRRGLGKAYIELTNSKDKMEYLDTLIFACTHDCTNDFIFEGPKGEYLYQMIQLYDLEIQNRIMYIIIDSLNTNDSRSQIFQKLDLLMCYIDDNLDIIQNALDDFYKRFITETQKWTKNKLLSFEIISIIMDRAFGKKKTKEVLNFIIKEDLDKDSFRWYFSILEDKYKKDKSIQEIVKHEEIEIIKREYTFDELLASNDETFIRGFGFNANDEELKKAANYLSETQDINQIKKILNVYTANEKVDIKYNLPIELCFKLLKKYEVLIEKEVYDVLKYYKSDEVLNLGLKLIEDKDFLYYGLVMLFTNYLPKYRKLIIETYKKIDFSFKSYNEITSDTIWFMNHKRKNYPDEILLINFYKSYDSFMREYIYDVMEKRNLLTIKIIEECKYDFGYELREKALKDSMVFYKQIIDSIYSLESKKFLKDNKNNISNLQWASLVMKFIKKDRVYFLMYLRDKTKSNYEKELFNLSINDLNKYGYISEETDNYYSINDPRGDNKPKYPFDETIIVPIVFDIGDIVVCENYIDEYYYIWKKPDESEIDDPTYLCYLINAPIRTKDDMFDKHSHLSAFSINKVADKDLPVRIVENAKGIKELIDKYGDDLLK